jgi:outer membrane receptor protein involved in Fe transport
MAPQSVSATEDAVFHRTLKAGALCAIALGLGITTSAYAQDAANPQAAEQKNSPLTLDEVTVTGTRIKQREDYVSPNPIQTIDASEMQRLGIVNVSEAVTQVPANVSQFTPANTGGSAFFVGSTLANLRGLNPFFGTRTLTLVDTHRFIPTTQGDSVDLNFIPSNLIERTEVVTGGASAAYGSGAISGDVNIFLNHRLNGIKVDADYGQSEESDGKNYHFGFGAGTDLFGGRSHIIFGGEYQKSEAIQSCSDARDWCSKSVGAFSNDASFAFASGQPYNVDLPFTFPPVPRQKIPGQPWSIISSNMRQNQLSTTGVIVNVTPLAPTTTTKQLNAAGNDVTTFNLGQLGYYVAGGTVVGGDGESIYKNLSLYPEVERKTLYSRMNFDFTDSTVGYVEASWGNVVGVNHQWQPGQNAAYSCIRSDNAFLAQGSAGLKSAMAAAVGNSPFSDSNTTCGGFLNPPGLPQGTIIQKDWSAQNDQTVTTDTTVTRAVLGLDGTFGSSSWSWGAYYQWGKTSRDQIGRGYRTNQRFTLATDAVLNAQGQIVCRVTRDGVPVGAQYDPSLAQGCKPLNPFGLTAASPEALAYAFGSLTEHDDIKQNVVAATATGEIWDGFGAGPVSTAVGLEWRRDELTNDAGDLPFAQRTDFGLQYGDSFAGTTTVYEGFGEVEVPLLKDLAFAKRASLNGAVRKARYKTEGGLGTTGASGTQDITSWKVATVWDPIEWLRFRGSRSHDLRAASFRELYYSQSIPAGGFFGSVQNSKRVTSNGSSDPAVLVLSGNPELAPEVGDTITAGFVLSPGGWAENMHFSADWYKIKLTGGQALEQAQSVVNDCYSGANPAKCSQITFGAPDAGLTDPQSNITQVRAVYINQFPYETQGVDLGWDYLMPLDKLFSGAKGSFAFRLQGTYALKTLVISGGVQRDIAGQSGGDQGFLSDFAAAPNFAGNFTVSYLNDPLTLTLQTRFLGKGRLDKQNPKTGPADAGFNPNLTYSVSDSTLPSYYVLNLNASYNVKWFNLENLNLWANVSNLLDKDPPYAAGAVGGTNAVYFDALGRTYRVGMRMAF